MGHLYHGYVSHNQRVDDLAILKTFRGFPMEMPGPRGVTGAPNLAPASVRLLTRCS